MTFFPEYTVDSNSLLHKYASYFSASLQARIKLLFAFL